MGALRKYMPVTHITFLLGCLAIAGIPPFSGFFSKDEILIGAYAKSPVLYYIGVAGAFMTAFYMFRLYATTFRGSFRGTQEQEHHLHESPAPITVPLIVLAILSSIAGFAGIPAIFAENAHALERFLEPVFAASERIRQPHEMDHQTEWILLVVSLVVAAAGATIAYAKYSKLPDLKNAEGIGKVLENKWYVDELYDNIVVRPLNALGRLCNSIIEKMGIDWIVNGVGRGVQYGSRQLRFLQSGQVGNYILLMVVSILVFFAIELFFKK